MTAARAIAALVSAAAPALALAQITPISAVQSTGADWTLYEGDDTPVVGGYALTPADPLASWSPADQSFDYEAGSLRLHLDSYYQSTVTPSRVEARMGADVENGGFMSIYAEYEYEQVFTYKFSVAAPTQVQVGASIDYNGGWHTQNPRSITFGRDGDAPLFASAPGNPERILWEYAPQEITLLPGTYTVHMINSRSWGGRGDGAFSDFEFTMVVPAPGAAAFALAGLGLAVRRRR